MLALFIAALSVFPLVRLVRLAFAAPRDSAGRPFIDWLWYSARAPLVLALVVTIMAAFTGYALSRRRPGSGSGVGTVLLAGTSLLLPIYIGLKRLGATGPAVAMFSLYALIAIPFCTWILKRAADRIPPAVLDAARVDGCSAVESLRLVILPLLRRALIASAIFAFVTAWDLHILYSDPLTPARLSAGLLLSLPLVILFVIIGSRVGGRDTAAAA
jgi:ABC-type glycerol-3-phosphate transport system permease component